ncbi:RuBisCO large subunit C-terminal-like domain-containing protein [Streptomyces sp. QL37]|uniref:RuBisCO large subunit C-terminal-like domain-containing protein n=1 Tax=Streptomyces sp. QL37 TaxID=2093747 RepID=UPI001C9E7BC5|nr:RuBisCO large subunit C-terminal-like domain-containing protein [Streptomyces sp. QL37]
MTDEQVVAVYDVESWLPPARAAEVLANEQSTGTFVRVPGESEALRHRFGATVLDVTELPDAGHTPLPGATRPPGAGPRPHRARVRIAFPLRNFGPSMPNLLAAVAGNLFELRELAAVRLVDLELPAAFAGRYPGPAFGVTGTRRLMGAPDGALIGTIIKPGVGLQLDALRALVRELASAGIDFIKDDELTGNPPHAPLRDRVAVVTEELDRAADRTGRRTMYAFNITDDIGRLEANHDLVLAAGGTCVMVCVQTVGLAAVAHLRERAALPVHGHRAMSGALLRSPQIGLGPLVFQRLARLAGVDQLHVGGIASKFYEKDEDVVASVRAMRTPFLGGYEALPVLSSGQWPGLAHRTLELTGTTDLLVLAGGGIHAHPAGPAAGVAAMRSAWRAAAEGEPLADRAARDPSLALALERFGGVRA